MMNDIERAQGLEPGAEVGGRKVYLIGVCGTAMAALAGLLKEKGAVVAGSDTGCYPPMSELLAELGINVLPGFRSENITRAFAQDGGPDLVVVGNVATRENPEAAAVLDAGLPCVSFPQALYGLFLHERTNLVVAGTHGKTTTSTMLVSALEGAGERPGFMIGGIALGEGRGFRQGRPPYFVLEGDEYDTAFFDKRPKFLHYAPTHLIITSIEYDHGDIYQDISQIEDAFARLVAMVPPGGTIVACWDWPSVRRVCEKAACKVITYGHDSGRWRIGRVESGAREISFTFGEEGKDQARLSIPFTGLHNCLNALAVYLQCLELGLDTHGVREGLGGCRGARRRQETRAEIDGVTVVDDFAHHPTAVEATLMGLKAANPSRRLVAVFEPRTNTSRRSVFQDRYARAFDYADLVLLREVPQPEKAPAGDRFSVTRLKSDLENRGKTALIFADGGEIARYLAQRAMPGDLVVIMSNGAFDQIHTLLIDGLMARKEGRLV